MHSTATAASTALAAVVPQVNGRVPVNQDAGVVERVEVAEALHDHVPGLPLVCRRDLLGRQLARDRNFPGEVVGMCCAEDRDPPAGLRERRGVG